MSAAGCEPPPKKEDSQLIWPETRQEAPLLISIYFLSKVGSDWGHGTVAQWPRGLARVTPRFDPQYHPTLLCDH